MKKYLTLLALLLVMVLPIGCAPPADFAAGAAQETRFRAVIIDHNLDIKGDADVDGTLNADAIDIDGALQLDSTLTVGVDGTSYDVTFYSDTAGDKFLWDESAEALIITGTAAQDALNIADGNLTVVDNVVVSTGSLDVTAGATSLEVLTTGVDGTGADVHFYSDTAGDFLFYDESDEVLNIIGTNAATALNVSDGNVVVNDDLTVTAGAFGVTAGASTFGGDVTASGANTDVTLSTDATHGNALAKNEFVGLPRIMNYGIGTMANGATNTVIVDIGDSETPATDWTAINANVTMSNDTAIFRQGTASLKMAVADAAVATDGCTNALATGDQDWTADEGFGMWFRADRILAAGDFMLVLDDSVAADTEYAFPAYTTADVWEWIEIDVTVADASKDVLQNLNIELSTAGAAHGVFNAYFDFIVKWDVADEDTLGNALPYDGVLSLTIIDATTTGATSANLTLYSDYFVHYQSGNEAIVTITDQSGADIVGLALIAY